MKQPKREFDKLRWANTYTSILDKLVGTINDEIFELENEFDTEERVVSLGIARLEAAVVVLKEGCDD